MEPFTPLYSIKIDMRYLILFALCLLMACIGNNGIETVENPTENGGKERFERRKSDFAKQGHYQRFFANGTVAEEAFYQNDTLHGERKLFFPNGTMETLETYRNGQFHGPYRHYFENGVLEVELMYENNAIEGIARAWYSNGVLKETVTFKASEENGPFIEYYDNGNLKAEGTYSPGDDMPMEQGELKEYDEQGRLKRQAYCTDGRCATTWLREEN